jgi:hypothetical protein
MAEALRILGLRPAGGNHKTLKNLIERYGISIEHFDPYWTQRGQRRPDATPLASILVEHSTYSRNHLKRRLYDEGLKRRACELCGQDEHWRGRQMALILDHINGIATDNRLETFRSFVRTAPPRSIRTAVGRIGVIARPERASGAAASSSRSTPRIGIARRKVASTVGVRERRGRSGARSSGRPTKT